MIRTCTLYNHTRGNVAGHRIGYADRSLSRLVGLLGRRRLDAGEGIWIRPSSGIHTFAMAFAIDVIGLDRELRVVRLWPNLRPWRIPMPSLRITSVVELAAGEISMRGINLGDLLRPSLHCT